MNSLIYFGAKHNWKSGHVAKIYSQSNIKTMNKQRREQIEKLSEQLSAIKYKIDNVLSDEIDYHDNVPENMQSGERYEQSETAIDNLESAMSYCDDAISALDDVVNG